MLLASTRTTAACCGMSKSPIPDALVPCETRAAWSLPRIIFMCSPETAAMDSTPGPEPPSVIFPPLSPPTANYDTGAMWRASVIVCSGAPRDLAPHERNSRGRPLMKPITTTSPSSPVTAFSRGTARAVSCYGITPPPPVPFSTQPSRWPRTDCSLCKAILPLR